MQQKNLVVTGYLVGCIVVLRGLERQGQLFKCAQSCYLHLKKVLLLDLDLFHFLNTCLGDGKMDHIF